MTSRDIFKKYFPDQPTTVKNPLYMSFMKDMREMTEGYIKLSTASACQEAYMHAADLVENTDFRFEEKADELEHDLRKFAAMALGDVKIMKCNPKETPDE